jgi:hypothetical protein
VAKIMRAEALQPSDLDRVPQIMIEPRAVRLALAVSEQVRATIDRAGECPEDRLDLGRHFNVTGRSVLAPGNGNHAELQIEVYGTQMQKLAAAQPRGEQDGHALLITRGQHSKQAGLLIALIV